MRRRYHPYACARADAKIANAREHGASAQRATYDCRRADAQRTGRDARDARRASQKCAALHLLRMRFPGAAFLLPMSWMQRLGNVFAVLVLASLPEAPSGRHWRPLLCSVLRGACGMWMSASRDTVVRCFSCLH